MDGGAPDWPHIPVLYQEVLEGLEPLEGTTVVDATVGAGGHAEGLARRIGPEGRLLGLDRDPRILEFARRRLEDLPPEVDLVHASYDTLVAVCAARGLRTVDRVLMDLGASSLQLDDPGCGMSFRFDGPLDMRFDPTQERTALDLLRELPEEELGRVFREYGEEKHAGRIARILVRAREGGLLPRTTRELADLVARAVPRPVRRSRIHPATRVFQALRIAVNRELEILERGLEQVLEVLAPGGRLAVISFHSLEDRRVKRFLRARMEPLFRRPVVAGSEERRANPRSRSAKLRIAVRGRLASDPWTDHREGAS